MAGRKLGKCDSYSDDAHLPKIPDYNPGGDDFYVQTVNRGDNEYNMEKRERGLHDCEGE